jgi:hypothetical protein
MSTEALIRKQNRDGGWPYVAGGSWTEPTVLAILALESAGETAPAERGVAWLRSLVRSDGGWPPRREVDQSSWVTALVTLLGPEQIGAAAHRRAIAWLLDTTGEETTVLFRFREWLLGNDTPVSDPRFPAWPWLPGTAAWVGPTSIAILALDKENRRQPAAAIRRRIDAGRQFLLSRACDEGGWNHGAPAPLGYPAPPYPETTGMALAALRGIQAPQVDRGLTAAERFLAECRSADALNWLRFGLRVHGRLPAGYCTPSGVIYRTVPETSLDLVMTAAEQGNDRIWG